MHGVLIVPAIPGEAGKWVTVEPKLLQVMFGDIVGSLFHKKNSYAKSLLTGADFSPGEKDLQKLLGPMKDKGFEKKLLMALFPYPELKVLIC